jgi:predicted Rdx family selenoprotein
LAVALEDEFGSDVQVKSVRDPGTTGRFEVTIVEGHKLIYSKATKGQQKCESSSDRANVIGQIREFLDSQKK